MILYTSEGLFTYQVIKTRSVIKVDQQRLIEVKMRSPRSYYRLQTNVAALLWPKLNIYSKTKNI